MVPTQPYPVVCHAVICAALFAGPVAGAAGQAPVDSPLRTAALTALQSDDENVRLSGLRLFSRTATAADVPRLAQLASGGKSAAERDLAADILGQLAAQGTEAALLVELEKGTPPVRAAVIRVLAARHATKTVPLLLKAAADADAAVRLAAAEALQVLADEKAAPALIKLLGKSPPGEEREAFDRAVCASCRQIADPQRRTEPLLAALRDADVATRCALLPALGRLGGPQALTVVQAAMGAGNADIRDAGVRALCNWPDASLSDQLLRIAETGQSEAHRTWALRGLVRVAVLPGQLPPAEALALLKRAMSLAQRPEDKQLILSRLAAVRLPEALEFTLSHVDDKSLRAEAAKTVVALAEALRETHRAQARAALEKVLPLIEDRPLRLKAERLLARLKS